MKRAPIKGLMVFGSSLAKAEKVGLMRHMIKNWYGLIAELMTTVDAINK